MRPRCGIMKLIVHNCIGEATMRIIGITFKRPSTTNVNIVFACTRPKGHKGAHKITYVWSSP